jgi:hypothetical protein
LIERLQMSIKQIDAFVVFEDVGWRIVDHLALKVK